MSPGLDAAQARRYLLGQATEAERSALELEYFHSDEAVDRMAAAEDDLIEDYLSDRLDPVERGLFERDYLAARESSPARRDHPPAPGFHVADRAETDD